MSMRRKQPHVGFGPTTSSFLMCMFSSTWNTRTPAGSSFLTVCLPKCQKQNLGVKFNAALWSQLNPNILFHSTLDFKQTKKPGKPSWHDLFPSSIHPGVVALFFVSFLLPHWIKPGKCSGHSQKIQTKVTDKRRDGADAISIRGGGW